MILKKTKELFAKCKKCKRLVTGFKQLKENGYFDDYEKFICKKCREKNH